MAYHNLQFPQENLSARSLEILGLLAEGMSDREIAERLMMTVNTIKWYNRQIYSILGVGSRTQAIARARELHLLDETTANSSANHKSENHLPVETTHFMRHNHEHQAIKPYMNTTGLMTRVESTVAGKTRLALDIARDLGDQFPDGVYFVSLVQVSDPALVINTIASVIGSHESPQEPLIENLKQVLGESKMLLVLNHS
jgi:DNA-binding CsgD family transcriptional regulator